MTDIAEVAPRQEPVSTRILNPAPPRVIAFGKEEQRERAACPLDHGARLGLQVGGGRDRAIARG